MSTPVAVLLLLLIGLGAGALDGIVGLGGGLLMIAVLSAFLPPQTVVVVTAPVLLVGSLLRSWLFRRDVDGKAVGWFAMGMIPSVVVGGLLLTQIPQRALEVAMGTFLLGSVIVAGARWHRATSRQAMSHRPFSAVGAVSGFVAATVGGSGPIIAPFLTRRGLEKERFVSTMALMAVTTVLAKTAVYSASGLLVAEFIPAIALLSVAILIATSYAKRLLGKMSPSLFRILLASVVTLAGVRLLVP